MRSKNLDLHALHKKIFIGFEYELEKTRCKKNEENIPYSDNSKELSLGKQQGQYLFFFKNFLLFKIHSLFLK